MWIWFDQNVFEFINIPVPSYQFHFDSFVPFKVLKPIVNLNCTYLLVDLAHCALSNALMDKIHYNCLVDDDTLELYSLQYKRADKLVVHSALVVSSCLNCFQTESLSSFVFLRSFSFSAF